MQSSSANASTNPRMLFKYSHAEVVHTEDKRILKQDTSDKQDSEFVDGIILQTYLCLNIYSVEMGTSLPHPSTCSTNFTNAF